MKHIRLCTKQDAKLSIKTAILNPEKKTEDIAHTLLLPPTDEGVSKLARLESWVLEPATLVPPSRALAEIVMFLYTPIPVPTPTLVYDVSSCDKSEFMKIKRYLNFFRQTSLADGRNCV